MPSLQPSSPSAIWKPLLRFWGEGSGPLVARTFHRALAAIFFIAFLSLGSQIDVLIGSHGLLPAEAMMNGLRARGVDFWSFPTLFLFDASDAALHAGIWEGALLSVLAFFGVLPRVCFAFLTLLYMSYTNAAQVFLFFQWDFLLIECGFLAVFLPRDRPARIVHILFLVVFFKLYFESGIAKWQSHLKDWNDGSAMTYYYETAPIPTRLAWTFHNLPAAWHHFESYATLALELVVPFFAFCPRLLRLSAAVLLTGFQLVNLSTANYGFFCYLALALHLFLLDDRDLERVRGFLRRALLPKAAELPRWRRGLAWLCDRATRGVPEKVPPWPPALSTAVAGYAAAFTVTLSVMSAGASFARSPWWNEATAEVRGLYDPFHVVNTYHLFGHITRDRFEPEFQTSNGTDWTAHVMHYKPGPVDRPPPLVAPHQPRVDFRLWFYALGFRQGPPAYVRTLLDRMCSEPERVQPLFVDALPPAPTAVRIAFWRYHFTKPEERERTGAYWKRELLGTTSPLSCQRMSLPQ
jgi:hypothetical protein